MNETDGRIFDGLKEKRSFVLDAGAGSGKTHSLVTALHHAVEHLEIEMTRRGQRIACITFTNVAKDEIIARVKGSPLVSVSTIHVFLWGIMRGHQKALKRALLKLNDSLPDTSRRKRDPVELTKALPQVPVTYSETGSNYLEGRLHHEDLLEVSKFMIEDNSLLAKIVATQYPYILMDEYQDASPTVMALLIDGIVARNPGRVVLGLFGDKLQHIYDGGVGELPAEQLKQLDQIIKSDNYRCSLSVIELLNRLRRDIQQTPGPSNSSIPGDTIYIRVKAPASSSMECVRAFVRETRGWSSEASTERELYLTHRLISRKSGYDGLLSVFDARGGGYRDRLLTGEEPRISFFLRKIEPLAISWKEGRSGNVVSMLRKDGFALSKEHTKSSTSAALEQLLLLRGTETVGEVLRHVFTSQLVPLPDDIRDRLQGRSPAIGDTEEAREREQRDATFYQSLFSLSYSEIVSFALFFEEHTPYSTQHGVKGAEFDTVFVVLDDNGAKWHSYSFGKYLTGEDEAGKPERFRRTRNIFYVCCSRAMRNLAIVDFGASNGAKDAAVRKLFGSDRCFEI